MNSIYKVIWSKAKNCYVVASEIAKSHTKSASGSEKMGGYGKKALLALAAASAIFCGGLVNVGATVHVNEGTGVTSEVYTTGETYNKTEVDNALTAKGAATDVATNKAAIIDLKNAVGDAGSGLTKEVAEQKAAIAANTTALDGKANKADVYSKAEVDTAVAGAVATAGTNVDTKLAGYAKTADVDTKLAGKADKATTLAGYGIADAYSKGEVDNALNKKADKATTLAGYGITDAYTKAEVDTAVAGAVTTAGTNVDTKLVDYAKTADVDTKLAGKADKATTLAGYGITDAYTKGEVDTALGNKADKTALTQATDRITMNEGNITALQNKTINITHDAAGTSVDGVTFNAGKVTGVTSIDGTEIGTKEGGAYIQQDNSIWGNMKIVDTHVKANTDAIAQEKTDREAADNDLSDRIGTVTDDGNYIKKSATNNVSENLKVLDTQAKNNAEAIKQETADRKAAIGELAVDGNYIKKDKNVSDNLVELDKQAKTNADAITETNQRTHGITRNDIRNETSIEGKVTVDTDGNIKAEGTITSNGLNAGDGDIKTNGTVSAGNVSTGTLKTTGDATIGGNLNVKGTLNTKDVTAETIHISKSEDNTVYKSEGKIIGEGGNLSVHNEKTYKSTNITKESELNVNEEGTVNWATSKDNATGNVTEGRSEVKADNIKNYVKKTEGGTTFGYEENITETGKVGTATDKDGNTNELTQTATGTENTVTSKDGNKSTTKQEAGSISSTVYDKDGNVKASSEMKEDGSISNNATGDMTNTVGGNQSNKIDGDQVNTIGGNQTTTVTGDISNTAKDITNEANEKLTDKVGDNTRVTTSTSITDTVGTTTNRKIEDGTITDTAGDFTVTTDKTNGTTFAKTGSTAYSTDAGAPTDTNIAGNHITTGRVDANELGVSDKDGANTADLSVKAGEGVKASASNGTITGSLDVTAEEVGSSVTDASGKGSTFKQRIDAIMMESKNVSVKAEETLTNEAKVITNKASEVINNEAININNTATGIITSKASEIKNQADKLISNKVGENTWENMENGKITTSIKDGAKQNLTQSNAAGTTQSTVDGAKSTVTIQNADGLTGAVTDGRNTSVQNQTASAIATDVKDGAGNENASVANATTSANTITNGTKANTVISTADGTSFINSEANTAFVGGTYTDTTIKGNTITTGKVTMDYADVMKDLGVHGSATVDHDLTVKGITNTKTLNVTEDAKVGRDLSVDRDLAVGGNAKITGDVTANSYKVGDKTYISAAGINANNQKITNVADGSISEGSKDAVNGGQLYGVKRDLEHQVDKVGANAAAMANLRPMEFDPSSKWNIAAAIGNYGSETAAALGAFYRPNDNVMVNLSTAFGTGENMVGGGVSVRLGKGGNKLSREETNALKAQVNDLTARMDALLSVLNPNMSKDFPDVPENHWAYEAVSRLAGNDIVQGYPDGEFHGERTMTRYEMAEIIYNALSRGAEAERELVEEFKPELQAMAASEKATAEKAEG